MVSESIIGQLSVFQNYLLQSKSRQFLLDFCLCGNLTIVAYKLIEINF